MRGVRSLIVLVVVFAGLAAYIYFVESKKPVGGAEPPKDKVFAVEADKIAGLTIKAGSGERTVLKKDGNAWRIVEPVQASADESEVSGITSNLASLEIQRVVDDNPADLEQYGLAQPRVEVGLEASDGKKTQLVLGDKTATGGDMYARLADQKRVFLVLGYLDSTFNRTPFDLRDKTLLKFDRNTIDTMSIVTPGHSIEMAKKGEDWAIRKPVEAKADFGTVEGLIGRLQTAQMKSIAATDASDLPKYGLDKPAATVVLGGGSARTTLEIGKAGETGTVYARDASRPMIYTVESSLADELKKPADDYRRKELFEFRAFNATHVEITRAGATLVFEKVKGQGKDATDTWRQVKPTARDVDTTKFDTFLSRVSNLRAASFVDPKTPTGLQSPALAVFVRFDEGKKEERVAFARVGTDVFASRPGEPGAAKVETTEYDDLIKALDEVK